MNRRTRLEALKNTVRERLTALGVVKIEFQMHRRILPVQEWQVGVYFHHTNGKRTFQESLSYYTDTMKDSRDIEQAMHSFYEGMGFEVIFNPTPVNIMGIKEA